MSGMAGNSAADIMATSYQMAPGGTGTGSGSGASAMMDDVEWALSLLKERFATVVSVPSNHELWTPRGDPLQLRGEPRYLHLG